MDSRLNRTFTFTILALGALLGTAHANYRNVVPVIAASSFDGGTTQYRTTIVVVNRTNQSTPVYARFYAPDGDDSTIEFDLPSGNPISAGTGSQSIGPGERLTFRTAPAKAGITAWAMIAADQPIAIEITLDLIDLTSGSVISQIRLPASPPDMNYFSVPILTDGPPSLSNLLGIINTGEEPASITLTAIGGAGNLERATLELSGLNQRILSLSDLFVDSDRPTVAAIGIVFDGPSGGMGYPIISFPEQLASPLSGAGSVGPAGPVGPAGADGIDGADGVDGADGAVGPQGPIGLTGPAGVDGVDGADGAIGPQGPIGLTGPAGGLDAVERVMMVNSVAETKGVQTATASCSAGKKVIGGGYEITRGTLVASNQYKLALDYNRPNSALTGWEVRLTDSGTGQTWGLTVWAICATAS